ncbi:MAG: SpoIIE family protein phosphatase [Deltaproteobacteria bacterium]|nr:SpoIIE family protein phosphatase [Deltaproteobacteria bacterium]MDQ3298116.1 SpoIIE family protein phosphatase [Myxococcota bacterium]
MTVAGGRRRAGASLSVKMILTTTLLIIVTVVGSGLLNVFNIRRVFDDTTQRQQELFSRGRETLGEIGTPLFARAVQQLLIDRGRDPDIVSLVRETVAQDTKDQDGRKDYGLKLAFVLDLNQNLVAHCYEDAKLECIQGATPHEPVGPALGQLSVTTWQRALEAWKAAADTKGPALVRFDVEAAGSRYRVFAFPVFIGDEPTAAGAIAADRPEARQGYVILGYDLAPIAWFATSAAEQKAEASTRAALYTGAVGALFALIGTLLAIFQGLSISRPIKQLAWKADQIARGDLMARVEITSSDEIGFLGENFNFMADQITILLQQTAEKARIEQELEVARAIQETLVPTADPVDKGALKFAGFYQPAAQTGGDWWTWSELASGKYLLVIGDVTGHGVPSAMITAAAKAACDVARHVHGDTVTVTRLLEIMNHAIYESAQRRFVMTCFASIVDTEARTITYANAGHNFPYLFRSSEGKGEFGSLMIRGNRLGDDRTSKYEAKTTELVPGDVIIWYTDGIVECENEAGDEYGEKRFRASVRKAAALDVGEMRDAIVADATTFFGEAPRKDDITMIIGRIA